MEEVELKRGRNAGVHKIYTVDEALAAGIKPVPWKLAVAGDWAESDDGFVMEVFQQWRSRRGVNLIKTVRGTFLSSGLRFTNEKRASRSTYTGKSYDAKFYFSDRIKLWATRVAAGGNPEAVYREIFGEATSKQYVANKVAKLLKEEQVIEFMKAELKPLMEKLGITQEFVLQGYLDLYRDGDISEHVRFKCLNEMAVLTGVKDLSEKPDDGGFLGFGDTFAEAELEGGGKQAALPGPDDEQPVLEELEEKHGSHQLR